MIEQGGVETRRQTYRSRMGRIRSLLTEIGVRPFLDDDEVSCVLHAYELPSTTNYIKLHDDLKAQGFVIYAGQGPYAEKIFRISMMGEIADSDVDRLGRALQAALRA